MMLWMTKKKKTMMMMKLVWPSSPFQMEALKLPVMPPRYLRECSHAIKTAAGPKMAERREERESFFCPNAHSSGFLTQNDIAAASREAALQQ